MRIALMDYKGITFNYTAYEAEGRIVKTVFVQQISGDQKVYIEYTDGEHIEFDPHEYSRRRGGRFQAAGFACVPAVRSLGYVLDVTELYEYCDQEQNEKDHLAEPRVTIQDGYISWDDPGQPMRYQSRESGPTEIRATEYENNHTQAIFDMLGVNLQREADAEGERNAERN